MYITPSAHLVSVGIFLEYGGHEVHGRLADCTRFVLESSCNNRKNAVKSAERYPPFFKQSRPQLNRLGTTESIHIQNVILK